ncbi:hypothetical protein J6590_096233 [Homalodisca vitripennis]|nr:hypothetical protein J6590_038161 [Homalodisca vitripennis]KAG8319227.1 hypothetical protein J6590_096233 [Homalodisca vitripennis]
MREVGRYDDCSLPAPSLYTGVIRTISTLDAESESHFWLTVFAQDHGMVPLRARLEVYVSVTNLNDNIPLTTEPVYYPHVQENSPAGTSILQITAEDADLDPNQRITFNITAGNVEGFFDIDSKTGILSTTRNKIDREYQAEHDIEITVCDNGNPPLSSTTRVVVIVDDVNDNPPQFEQSFYHVALPQNTRHKQSVFQRRRMALGGWHRGSVSGRGGTWPDGAGGLGNFKRYLQVPEAQSYRLTTCGRILSRPIFH